MAIGFLFASFNPRTKKLWVGWLACLCAGTLLVSSCRSSSGNANLRNSNIASINPPYSTKEPKTYQARYISSTEFGGEAAPLAKIIQSMKKERFVARDGGQRRLDFEMKPGIKLSYLQTSEGRFVLLPSKKVYAAIDANATSGSGEGDTSSLSDRTPEIETAGSIYEKLGFERLDGRETTKYRVTPPPNGQQSGANSSETLIWVDEEAGMPVKWQIVSHDGSGGQSTFTEEMHDFKTVLDADQFIIPEDFQLVSYANLKSQLN